VLVVANALRLRAAADGTRRRQRAPRLAPAPGR